MILGRLLWKMATPIRCFSSAAANSCVSPFVVEKVPFRGFWVTKQRGVELSKLPVTAAISVHILLHQTDAESSHESSSPERICNPEHSLWIAEFTAESVIHTFLGGCWMMVHLFGFSFGFRAGSCQCRLAAKGWRIY